jgi:hypothetical protein
LGERDRAAASAGFSDLIQINASAPNQKSFHIQGVHSDLVPETLATSWHIAERTNCASL